jgi:putative salt-induced outer membrane protein
MMSATLSYPRLLLAVFNLFSASVYATESPKSGEFNGEGELGYNSTAGNSNSSSLNAKLGLNYVLADWEHSLNVNAVSAQNEGVNTRERYLLDCQESRTFLELYYGFGNLRYDKDTFSGYDYQTNITGGIGRRFWQPKTEVLNLEVGVGYQVDKLQNQAERSNPILRTALKLRYPVNTQVALLQDLLVSAGEQNTHSESVSGVKVKMTESLALKLSYTLKHNSKVLLGRENLDTLTALTLVYGF